MDFDSIALPVGKGRPGASAGDARPENPPQAIEKTDLCRRKPGGAAPPSLRDPRVKSPGGREGWPPDLIHGEGPGQLAAGDDRPENRARSVLEKIKIRRPRLARPASPGSRARGGGRGLAAGLDPG